MSKTVYEALAAVQAGMSGVKKDGRGNRNQYISLDHLLSVARPLCAKHGLCILHRLQAQDGLLWVGSGVTLATSDPATVWIDVPIMPQDPGSKGGSSFAPWALGSAQTYGRRYGLTALFAVSSWEDDDGAAAQKVAPKKAPAKKPAKQDERGSRAQLIGSIIKSGNALGNLDGASKTLVRDNVAGVIEMCSVTLGRQIEGLTDVTTQELEQVADDWRAKRGEK